MEIAILWCGCVLSGIAAAAIARSKGGSYGTGFIVGLLLGPIGIIIAFYVGSDRQCPRCTEYVPKAAGRCTKCLADLFPGPLNNKMCPDCLEDSKCKARKCRFCGYVWPETPSSTPGRRALQAGDVMEPTAGSPVSRI
jgi:hypothetical protein